MREESEAQRQSRERHENHMRSVRAVQNRGQLQRVETKISSLELARKLYNIEPDSDQVEELRRQRKTLLVALGEGVHHVDLG